jgi:hypothetical protein
MDTDRRLKAVYMPPGAFLGDMTNFIENLAVPIHFLLGLLNSRVLNRRIKLTSTNNYLSAAEIEALPIPRISNAEASEAISQACTKHFTRLLADPADSIPGWLERIAELSGRSSAKKDTVTIPKLIELVAQAIQADPANSGTVRGRTGTLWSLLDALVLKLYGVEAYAGIF